MLHDLQMRLLELTADRRGVCVADLGEEAQLRRLNTVIKALHEEGLVSFSEGVISMDARQRMILAERLIHGGRDPKKVSSLLGWQEFEDFAANTLGENGFRTAKHFVFKSEAGRREIDVLAWNDTFLLAVDCKHWLRGLSIGRIREAAHAQIERSNALARRPELLHRLKIGKPEKRDILPVILTLGELGKRTIDGVPVVSVPKLLSFLYGLSPIDDGIQRIRVQGLGSQSRLQ